MNICSLGHEYISRCVECENIEKILQLPIFKKNEDILMEYLKTGNRSILDRLSNGQGAQGSDEEVIAVRLSLYENRNQAV